MRGWRWKREARLAGWLGVLALFILLLPVPAHGTPRTLHLDLDARQFEFTPPRFEVAQGDEVVIRLSASDVVHGFYLDDYGIERRVVPGVVEEIRFTADRAGKFRFRCSVSCGPMHPFMIGELVVTPNLPFFKAAGFVVLALGLLLAHRWRHLSAALSPQAEPVQGDR